MSTCQMHLSYKIAFYKGKNAPGNQKTILPFIYFFILSFKVSNIVTLVLPKHLQQLLCVR